MTMRRIALPDSFRKGKKPVSGVVLFGSAEVAGVAKVAGAAVSTEAFGTGEVAGINGAGPIGEGAAFVTGADGATTGAGEIVGCTKSGGEELGRTKREAAKGLGAGAIGTAARSGCADATSGATSTGGMGTVGTGVGSTSASCSRVVAFSVGSGLITAAAVAAGAASSGGTTGADWSAGEAGSSVGRAATDASGCVGAEGTFAAAATWALTSPSSIFPTPFNSQDMDTSGKASIMRCTTSKLGLLRSLRI